MFERRLQTENDGIDNVPPKKFRIREWMPVIALAITLGLVPAALYLSGVFYFAVHKINPAKAVIFSWIDYFLSDPSDRKKQLLSLFAGLFTTYALLPLSIYLATQKRRELHGSARFANQSEIRKAALLGNNDGIIVGKTNGQLMRFPGQQFVLLAAPTRSGKGVGIVIPNCLTWTHSLVVLDIKQENFNLTSGYREKVLGQAVYLFNPFAEETDAHGAPLPKTHRWNPFDNISKGVFRVGELMNLGRSFWPSTGDKEEFWNNLALNLFLGISLFLFELREQRSKEGQGSTLPSYPVSIGEVLRQSAGRGSGVPIKKYLSNLVSQYAWLSGECRDSISEFLSSSDDVLASILSTFNAPLGIWRNPIVDAATSHSDFDLSEVRKRRITVYIGVKPNQLTNAAKIINLLFSQLVNINTKELPKDNPSLRYSCLLLMDEFTAIGKVPIIAKAVSYIAGYNLRLLPIIQSVAQLESVYGKEDARTFVTNHAMQIIYAPREQKDANEYSEMLGYFTEKSTSVSRPKGFSSSKGGPSESVSDQRRALLLPQELKELGMRKEVVLLENTKPILCEKIQYFEDSFFMERILPAASVTPLDMPGFIARSQNRHRPVDAGDTSSDERIAENKRAQLLAMENMDWEQPPADAPDTDWIAYGANIALANTPITHRERQGCFADVLSKLAGVAASEIKKVAPAQIDADLSIFALAEALEAAPDRIPDAEIEASFAAPHFFINNTYEPSMSTDSETTQKGPDADIGVGGTPIDEADIPLNDLEYEYIEQPEID